MLRLHKFTNAYRASDRASQYLIRRVIYRDDLPADPPEVVFRILLFKVFNRIETWELFERTLGPITYSDFSFEAYDKVLTKAMKHGESIYSAAYIMPSGGTLGHVFYKGEPFGDSLTDNADVPDGYGFHDAIHLAFAAVLGWSPLTRKLLKVPMLAGRMQ